MTRRPDLPAGCRLFTFDSVRSTNEEAKNLAADGADAWTFVIAREQTRGRGRFGNGWVSPPGNLYVSVILRPPCDAAHAAQLGFVAALALADAIAARTGLEARLKWPNDLQIDGRKVSGILVESSATRRSRIAWAVIGTGVNIASHPAELAGATSLRALGRDVAVSDMVESYAGSLRSRVAQWLERGFGPVRTDWLARATGLGDPIRVRLADRIEEGIFENLDDSGALVLAQGSERRIITSGDVFPATVG
jgi:BirA family biotin operon repressor/biotin-[acetyl-CoA-carboxylase] ligase